MKNDEGLDVAVFVLEDGNRIEYNSDCVIPGDIDGRKVMDIEY